MFSSNPLKSEDTLDFQMFREHKQISKRLTKTFYYGICPGSECLSVPLTDIAVELFSKASPSELGKIDDQYVASVSRNACISPCSMMLAMVYIERLKHRNPEYLCNVSSSDLFLVSMMVASKYLYDDGEDDEVFCDEWAESGSISLPAIIDLERNFLAAIDWSIFVKPSDFFSVLLNLEARVALRQGSLRGWYSYTDLQVLSNQMKMSESWEFLKDNVLKVTIVCLVTYVAGVLSVVIAVVITMNISHQKDLLIHQLQSNSLSSGNFSSVPEQEGCVLKPEIELSCNLTQISSEINTFKLLLHYQDFENKSSGNVVTCISHYCKINQPNRFLWSMTPSGVKSNNLNRIHRTII